MAKVKKEKQATGAHSPWTGEPSDKSVKVLLSVPPHIQRAVYQRMSAGMSLTTAIGNVIKAWYATLPAEERARHEADPAIDPFRISG